MEKTDKAALIPADIGWSDVGTWRAVWELSERDDAGNSVRGNGVVMDARNVHVRSDDTLTTVVGVDDVIVVTTQDAVLVLEPRAWRPGQAARRSAEDARTAARPASTSASSGPGAIISRIDEGQRYQVKRIVVKPGERLSLQKHFHRAEHWIVVRGTAEVGRDEEIHLVHENESIYLPIGCKHRLTNPGKIDLELIEVQTGSYLGEDDIVRFEDAYNRGVSVLRS